MIITTIPLQTFVLSQVFGLYLLIMALVLFDRADYYRSLIQEIKAPGISFMLNASLGLLIGLFLIIIHTEWVFAPRVVITILCWLFTIKCVAWLIAPVRMLDLTKRICLGKSYYVVIGLMGFLAIQMTARAFYLYITLYVHHAAALPIVS